MTSRNEHKTDLPAGVEDQDPIVWRSANVSLERRLWRLDVGRSPGLAAIHAWAADLKSILAA